MRIDSSARSGAGLDSAHMGTADMQKQAIGVGKVDGIECWEEAEATTFMVRGQHYMQDKKKVPSEDSIYRQARQPGMLM